MRNLGNAMRRLQQAATIMCAALLAVLTVGSAGAQSGAGNVSVRGAGSTFSAPLYKAWAEAYGKSRTDTAVTYDSVGSGEGVSRFVAGSVDFGASDQPLGHVEAGRVARGAVVVPITAGMIVVAYNLPGVQGELKLPRDIYVDIFSGKITRWNDPRLQQANPDLKLPQHNIALIGRQDGSGTTHAFTMHMAAISSTWMDSGPGVGKLVAWPTKALLARGNEGVSHLIKISDGAIGYVEYGFAKRLGLPVAALQNRSGAFVKPSEQTAQRALAEALSNPQLSTVDPASPDAYPIVTYSWLFLYRSYPDEKKAAALKAFVTWSLSEGQKLGEPLGYVPLPAEVGARGREALALVK